MLIPESRAATYRRIQDAYESKAVLKENRVGATLLTLVNSCRSWLRTDRRTYLASAVPISSVELRKRSVRFHMFEEASAIRPKGFQFLEDRCNFRDFQQLHEVYAIPGLLGRARNSEWSKSPFDIARWRVHVAPTSAARSVKVTGWLAGAEPAVERSVAKAAPFVVTPVSQATRRRAVLATLQPQQARPVKWSERGRQPAGALPTWTATFSLPFPPLCAGSSRRQRRRLSSWPLRLSGLG